MKFINILSVYVQPGVHRRFQWRPIAVLRENPTVLMFVDINNAPKLQQKYVDTFFFQFQALGRNIRVPSYCLMSASLTLNMRGLSYPGLTRSISWLLMSWLLASPGHQQPWYWLCRIGRSLSYLRKDINHQCHINVEEWHKMWIYVLCSLWKNYHVKGWGHISNTTHSPTATRLGLCCSLTSCGSSFCLTTWPIFWRTNFQCMLFKKTFCVLI